MDNEIETYDYYIDFLREDKKIHELLSQDFDVQFSGATVIVTTYITSILLYYVREKNNNQLTPEKVEVIKDFYKFAIKKLSIDMSENSDEYFNYLDAISSVLSTDVYIDVHDEA